MSETQATPGPGHNQPPPDPFEASTAEIEMLYDEAATWLDGDPITTQGQAEALADLLNMMRMARDKADTARKEEVKPLDEAKAEIQAKWAPLIADTKKQRGKAILAIEGIKEVQTAWLVEQDRIKREAAEKERREAEEKERVATEAIRSSQALEERERAEALLQEAKAADRAATRAEKDTAKSSGGFGRAVSLRTSYNPVLSDPVAALTHYWEQHPEAITECLTNLARQEVRRGIRSIPGFDIEEVKTSV